MIDETIEYAGLNGCQSKRGLCIRTHGNTALMVLSELPDNLGTSVTNRLAYIATQVYRQRLFSYEADNIHVVEVYPTPYFDPETWAYVSLEWDAEGGSFIAPNWMPTWKARQKNRAFDRLLAQVERKLAS